MREPDYRVMIDLETAGVKKNSAILSIGAVYFGFDGHIGSKFYANVRLETCVALGMTTDESTMMWWQKPENLEARQALLVNVMDVELALVKLRQFLLSDVNPEEIELWSNGTSFDLAILENAYELSGISKPWVFYREMDYRTMKSLFRVPKPKFNGAKHNALDDAVFQAEHLAQIMSRVNLIEVLKETPIVGAPA